jgi:hypothetical protein
VYQVFRQEFSRQPVCEKTLRKKVKGKRQKEGGEPLLIKRAFRLPFYFYLFTFAFDNSAPCHPACSP